MLLTVEELVAKARDHVKTCSAEEAARFVKETDNVLFVDVREPSEHSEKPVPGTKNIPRGVLEMKITDHTKDVDCPILIHCAKGGRAVLAAKALTDMGFKNVTAITAGCDDIAGAMA